MSEGEIRDEAARDHRRKRRARPGRADWFAWYWRDWLTHPAVRAMDRGERGGLVDVLSQTWGTASPGLYTEDQVRAWAGYSADEWPAHRERFLACHVVRPNGLWVHPQTRSEALATKTRLTRAKKSAREAAQKRWRDKDMNAVRMPQGDLGTSTVRQSVEPVSKANRQANTDAHAVRTGSSTPVSAGALAGEMLARLADVAGSEARRS